MTQKKFLEVNSNNQTFLTSESYDRIQNEVDLFETSSEFSEEDKIETKRLVDKIHEQASRNIILWESQNNPGVKEAISQIDILDLVYESTSNPQLKDLLLEYKAKKDTLPTELTVISSSSPIGAVTKCLADGGSHNGFDRINGRAMLEIARIVRSIKEGNIKNSKIILLGSPLASGGSVTEQFAKKIKDEGIYNSQAKLHAEFLNPLIEKSNVVKVLFHGHSFAAIQSIITAGMINSELQKKIRVLADDPVITHRPWQLASGLQVILGAGLEMIYQYLNGYKDDGSAKETSHESFLRQLDRLNISYDKTEGQANLKADLHKRVLRQILLGPFAFSYSNLLAPYNFKITMRKGIYDPTKLTLTRSLQYASLIFSSTENLRNDLNKILKKDGLGKNSYPIKKMHSVPIVNQKYVKRWVKTARDLKLLKLDSNE